MTFFWGTLFFVLLTLDVIPGLAELVSLVSEPFQMLQKEPPQAPLSACMHSGLISMHVVRESVIGVDACDACKAFTCPHRNVAESQGSSPSTRQACYGPFGMVTNACWVCSPQVSVPQSLAWRCVGLGGVSWILTNLWEQLLRRSFPSPRPPRKGYEVHKHLLRTGKGAAATNGALAGHEHAE